MGDVPWASSSSTRIPDAVSTIYSGNFQKENYDVTKIFVMNITCKWPTFEPTITYLDPGAKATETPYPGMSGNQNKINANLYMKI